MATMDATISGWALRAGGIWYPGSGVSSVNSLPPDYIYSGTNYISDPSGRNKYTAMIAIETPDDSSISSISELSISFRPWDRNNVEGILYGSLRTVSQSNGSSSSDSASTFRENAIGDEVQISKIGTSSSPVTISFSGGFSKGSTYYLFLYTKSTEDIYALDYGADEFSAEITYSKIQYEIKYDANGGSGAPSSQTKSHDINLVLSSVIPSKTDEDAGEYVVTLNTNGGMCDTKSLTASRTTSYTFRYWNTKRDGSGTIFNSGSTYRGNESLVLYAIYLDETTTSSVTLPTPIRTGYDFLGWGENAGSHSGIFGEYTPRDDITFYAIWGSKGLVYIFDGSNFSAFQIFIYDGFEWDIYCPYIYDDEWSVCS